MDRRKLLVSIGALGAGGAAAFGTEAFTSIEAERNVDVSVAGDSSAYLAFEALDSSNGNDYVTTESDDTLSITLDGDGSAGGSGVNQDAITQIEDLFKIVNQGTQSTSVYFEDDSDAVTFRVTRSTDTSTNGSNGQSLEGASNSVELDVGEQVVVGLTVDTLNNDVSGSLLDTVTVYADASASAPEQNVPQPQYVVDGDGEDTNTFKTLSAALDSSDVNAGSIIGIEGSASIEEDAEVTIEESVTVTGFNTGTPTVDKGINIAAPDVTLRNLKVVGDLFIGGNPSSPTSADGATIDGLTIVEPDTGGARGAGVTESSGVSIQNTKFEGFTTQISLDFAGGNVEDITIQGNTFQSGDKQSGDTNVAIGSTENVTGLSVTENVFETITSGVDVGGGASEVLIENNSFNAETRAIGTFADADIDAGDITNNSFSAAGSRLYIDDGAGALDLDAVVKNQDNTFDPDGKVVADQIRVEGTAPADTVVNLNTGDTFTGQAAIQDAIGAGDISTDDTLRVGAGSYDESVTVDVEGLTLEGAGADSTTIAGAGDGSQDAAVNIPGTVAGLDVSGLTVRGMTIEANSDRLAVNVQTATEHTDITFSDNTFVGNGGEDTVIIGGDSQNFTFDGNTFSADGDDVDKYIFFGGEASYGSDAASATSSENAHTVTDNTFTDYGNIAIEFEGQHGEIAGNTFDTDTESTAIDIPGAVGDGNNVNIDANNITIENNEFNIPTDATEVEFGSEVENASQ